MKAKWTQFSGLDMDVVIDANEVIAVFPICTSSGPNDPLPLPPVCLVSIRGLATPKAVDGSMEEVCAKLGIPFTKKGSL